MNELSPTDVALINRVNSLVDQIASAGQERWFNFASIRMGGRIGASSWGTIRFGVGDKRDCGELEFNGLEDCCAQLGRILKWATEGRVT